MIEKQLRIPKLFRKQATRRPEMSEVEEGLEELQNEIQELEQKLKEKQKELFLAQRCSYKRKLAPPVKKNEQFIRPEKIISQANIDHLKRSLELMTMLTGMEVRSYEANDQCVIVYHMQHKSEHHVEHGLRINMKSGSNEVSKFSLPLGFNFNAVMEDYDNVMTPECLRSLRQALVAFYDRTKQFKALKRLLSIDAQLSKVLDGSHMEACFKVESVHDDDDEVFTVALMLDYRVYDVRPKHFQFNEDDLPEEVAEALKAQCVAFKDKPLHKAFRECFLYGIGPYKFVHQVERPAAPAPRRRRRARTQRHNNDDTFRPEDEDENSSEEDEDSSEEDERRMRDVYARR